MARCLRSERREAVVRVDLRFWRRSIFPGRLGISWPLPGIIFLTIPLAEDVLGLFLKVILDLVKEVRHDDSNAKYEYWAAEIEVDREDRCKLGSKMDAMGVNTM